MPTARDALLDAAVTALATLPWAAVRMVDVAALAGVSRQTLYNEFGSKDGLARALVRRAADGYLAGVDRALGAHAGTGDGPVAVALWTVRAARANALVKALLTGFWGEWLPRPVAPFPVAPCPAGSGASSPAAPSRRRADAALPTPTELLALVRERTVAALLRDRAPSEPGTGGQPQDSSDLGPACEIALRLALSYAIAPQNSAQAPKAGPEQDAAPLVRAALARHRTR